MKAEQLRAAVLELHDAAVELPKHYAGVLLYPRQYIRDFAKKRTRYAAVASTLLLVNLLAAHHLPKLFSPNDDATKTAESSTLVSLTARYNPDESSSTVESSTTVNEPGPSYIESMSRYVAGTAFFVLVLGLFGRKLSVERRFTAVCLASGVFPLWVIAAMPFGSLVLSPLTELMLALMSSTAPTPQVLEARLLQVIWAAAPAVVVYLIFISWWLWLLATALDTLGRADSPPEGISRALFAYSTYVTFKTVCVLALLGAGLTNIGLGVHHFKSMKRFLTERPYDYPGALKEASKASDCKFMPPRARFILGIASAVAQEKVMFGDDRAVESAANEFRRERYRDSQMILQRVLDKRKADLKDPKRAFYLAIQARLDDAEKAFQDPGYIEVETMTAGLRVGPHQVPLALLP